MSVFVSIAEVVAELQECPDALVSMYRDYTVAPCRADIRLVVGAGPEGWSMLERRDFRLWVSPDRTHGSVVPLMGDGSIDRAFRMMMAEALPRRGGVLMHAAAAMLGERVVAFAGDSGAGKSTVARMIGPERMVADDTLAVDSQGLAWATPFHNWGQPIPKPARGPLGGVFVLEKAEVDEVLPVANWAAALMRHVLTGPPGYPAGQLLDAVSRLSNVPVAILRRTLHGDMERVLTC